MNASLTNMFKQDPLDLSQRGQNLAIKQHFDGSEK